MRCIFCKTEVIDSAQYCPVCGQSTGTSIECSATIKLGRDSSSDIVYNNPIVSRKHALITYVRGVFEICDNKSHNGVYVNGQRVCSSAILPTDQISLGNSQTIEWSELIKALDTKILEDQEEIIAHDDKSTYDITISVGRNHDNQIVVDHPKVSRHHALVCVEKVAGQNILYVKDLNSSNGLYVNGQRITFCKVDKSDHIMLSQNVLLTWERIEAMLNVIDKDAVADNDQAEMLYPQDLIQHTANDDDSYVSLSSSRSKKTNTTAAALAVACVFVILIIAILLFSTRNPAANGELRKHRVSHMHEYSILPGEREDIARRRANMEAQRELINKAKNSFSLSGNYATGYAVFDIQTEDQEQDTDNGIIQINLYIETDKHSLQAKLDYLNRNHDILEELNNKQQVYDANYDLLQEAEWNLEESYTNLQQLLMENQGLPTGEDTYSAYGGDDTASEYSNRTSSSDYSAQQNPWYNQKVKEGESLYQISLDMYEEQILEIENTIESLDPLRQQLAMIAEQESPNNRNNFPDNVAGGLSKLKGKVSLGSDPWKAFIAWRQDPQNDKESYLNHYEVRHGSRNLAEKWYLDIEFSDEDIEKWQNLADGITQKLLNQDGVERINKRDFTIEYPSSGVAVISLDTEGTKKLFKAVDKGMKLFGFDSGKSTEEIMEGQGLSIDDFSEKYYMRKENGKWKRYLHEEDTERNQMDYRDEQMEMFRRGRQNDDLLEALEKIRG